MQIVDPSISKNEFARRLERGQHAYDEALDETHDEEASIERVLDILHEEVTP